ncbi:CHAT domain-containing protein [Streptomyces sparsogenes]|uniref:CHAT domain-containing protein n=2 Tax=Streptomyces sparsogenes TaxID=67365 RepID=UPI00385134A9
MPREVCAESGSDPLAEAVRGVLRWASQDVARFTRLVSWLATTVYEPCAASSGQAAAEVAALGLDEPLYAPLYALLTGLRSSGETPGPVRAEDIRHFADMVRRTLHSLPEQALDERPRMARLHAALLVQANSLAPGTIDFADVDEAAEQPERDPAGRPEAWWWGPVSLEQYLALSVDMARALQTGDLGDLERLATRVRRLLVTLPRQDPSADTAYRALIHILATALSQAAGLGGSLQDAEAGLAVLRELRTVFDRERTAVPVSLTVSVALAEIGAARQYVNLSALPHVIGELSGLLSTQLASGFDRFAVAAALGWAHQTSADLGGDPASFRVAAHYYRQALRIAPHELPRSMRALFRHQRASLLVQLARLEPSRETMERAAVAVQEVIAGTGCPAATEMRLRQTLAQALLHAADRLDAPDLLGLCFTEVSRLLKRIQELAERREFWPESDTVVFLASDAVWAFARGRANGDEDRKNSLSLRSRALLLLAVKVLLQGRAEHGLAVARSGTVHALWLAHRRLESGEVADALWALELGRALVLRKTTASRGLSDRLTAAGRPDLAARWHAEVMRDLLGRETAALLDAPTGPQFAGTLRRRMMRFLPAAGGSMDVLEVPGVDELTAALATAGVDALVYLVPGEDPQQPGHALILRPAVGTPEPDILRLPLLTYGSPSLERYLDAAAQRSRCIADPTVRGPGREARDRHWQIELDELCDWAWPAAMGPVLAAIGRPGRTPRIVVVPCGRLGIVPWHAARAPREPGTDTGPEHRYACQEAIISYAPSGSQFRHATARERMPLTGLRVLVDDPELDLVWATIEMEALQASYPDALRYGQSSAGSSAADAPGTPEDLLAVLPGGSAPAAVVHIACHALAHPDPTRSALRLAAPTGAPPEAGHLTVARILDSTVTARRDTAGPLVVLSACETDLSNRDHDEALTLATALVSRGAADVVGSRWAVREAPAALMMAVFHHFLTAHGRTPADALRAAQLWMLDPNREPPPNLPPALLYEATRTDLHRVHHWAAFSHEGNPTTAEETDDEVTAVIKALERRKARGDRLGVATASSRLGMLLLREGRFDEAVAAHNAALDVWRELGDGHPLWRTALHAWAVAHNERRLRRARRS